MTNGIGFACKYHLPVCAVVVPQDEGDGFVTALETGDTAWTGDGVSDFPISMA